jgi:hypothetical protein
MPVIVLQPSATFLQLPTVLHAIPTPPTERRTNGEYARLNTVDEGRKRVLLIAASILAARKLAQYDGGKRVPATMIAIADVIRWAEEIMVEIDRRHPVKPTQEKRVT